MHYIKAVIGIIIKKNRIYISKSKKNKYSVDLWEFPGGKVKTSETLIHALKRELCEEIGITILNFSFLKYEKIFNKNIKLYFFLIKKWKGKIYSREGYLYQWIFYKSLKYFNFPKSNYKIIKLLIEKFHSFKKNKNFLL
ncbi:DNA mismatch repair protein MutT [Buchnera aphidicola (Melanaphis sacchari)]|uniref:8-oxo-dGTP diphosphatase n=1 Tax=Buchnera aphidicola (Melanaphis sacchari) TaxID=2173854 RepID=A0A2U8DFI7_9GAMM|nr:NUDIX domain-containing protein [Buchnera aphidicola]AWH90568.1 DNA mismatch repair protein MutT [Buchnera aphidicola (Melanaphis sacchari)]